MSNATAGLYTPPAELVGKTPHDLRYGMTGDLNKYAYGGLPEELAGVLGIGAQTPLENRAYTIVAGAGQPTEYLFRNSGFTQTSPYKAAEDALSASKPITEQAYAERGRQLEGEKQPLTDRYQSIIDELKGRETKETGQVSTALAREYGKRGVPLSSGAYEQDLGGKTRDISQFYGAQQKDVGFEREDKLRQISNLLADLPIERARELNLIDQKIGELKATGANQQLQMRLEMYRQEQEDKWRQQEMDLKKQSFELQKYDAGVTSNFGTKPASQGDRYVSLSEGSTLYDIFGGKALYKNPKTSTSKGASTNNDWEEI